MGSAKLHTQQLQQQQRHYKVALPARNTQLCSEEMPHIQHEVQLNLHPISFSNLKFICILSSWKLRADGLHQKDLIICITVIIANVQQPYLTWQLHMHNLSWILKIKITSKHILPFMETKNEMWIFLTEQQRRWGWMLELSSLDREY